MYAGYEYLDSVDLYDLNARYYNPKTSRFLSEDPYFNLGNRVIGLYEINVLDAFEKIIVTSLDAYCFNSPIYYSDKSGLDPVPKWALNIKYFKGSDSDYEKALEVYNAGTYTEWRGFASYPVMYAIDMALKEQSSFKYNWTGEHVTKAFKSKVILVSEKLNISPDDLMAVMAFESNFSPSVKNSSGYVGLIQFGKLAASELGTTREDLVKMDAVEQMDYVYLHLNNKLKDVSDPTLSDIYMAVFAPSKVGMPDTAAVYTLSGSAASYKSNEPLDLYGDGIITKAEATEFVIKRRDTYEKIQN